MTELRSGAGGWTLDLEDAATDGPFDVVLVSAPAPQSATLLAPCHPELAARAADADLAPCWTIMLGFDRRLDVGFDAAFVETAGPLRWVARNASKPGRSSAETWTVHADHAWTRDHLEMDRATVADRLTSAFFRTLGLTPRVPAVCIAHRWRHALVVRPLGVAAVYDPAAGVGVCGDWCLGPRVEAAFLSGVAAAGRVLGHAPDVVATDLFAGVAHPGSSPRR
ncbi:MAG: FAD-dependent oxidoreductase [Phycisphaerae bacterium]|nr:FAD-dependent oxidoreductase [Phycisphaerae bacterium]